MPSVIIVKNLLTLMVCLPLCYTYPAELIISDIESCFVKDGNLYCKYDYCRLFCPKNEDSHQCQKYTCQACQRYIKVGDIIQSVNDKKYHFACFQCSYCHQPILAGDSFKIQNGLLVCTKFNHEWNQNYVEQTKVSLV